MVVFGIMAIFSASHRPLAKEAFDCVFRRVTLRKCTSGFDIRLKTRLVGKVMRRSPKLAKPLYKYFEVFSWFFVILFFVSLFLSGQAVYNLAVYDNCNGPNADPEECLFVPNNQAVSCEDPLCEDGHCEECGDDCSCHDCDI
jgi:hypothetical protein